jgi:putative addiction module antidote
LLLVVQTAIRRAKMVKKVTVRQTGTSVSATIPKEMAERFHIAVGDTLFAIATEHGVLLTPYDPTVDRGLRAYERIARKYRKALRELAK